MNRIGLQSLGVKPSFKIRARAKSTYLKVSPADKKQLGEDLFRDFSLMMMYSDFLECTPEGSAWTLLKLVPETMFGPPEKAYYTPENVTDIPGVIVNHYGKGASAFIPWRLGSQYESKGNYMHRALFVGALRNILREDRTLVTDASPLIEVSRMTNRSDAFEWIGMINHAGQIGGSYLEPIPVNDISVRFKSARPVKEIWLMRAGKKIKFTESNGWVDCVVPQVEDFEMVVALYR
jgi:hypothetical protein